MTPVIYDYPRQAVFNRVIPKSKIYEKVKLSSRIRSKFVEQVDKIVWTYVLAPRSINIEKSKFVEEIAIFGISLKKKEIDFELLQVIDKYIRVPIFFELSFGSELKVAAAYKRPSDADSSKWVVDAYFESEWFPGDSPREPIPVALDMEKLYEKMLRTLMPLPAREGESLKDQARRWVELQTKLKELGKLQARLQREKQFNRKVQINAQLRSLQNEVAALSAE